ncbi:MAG: ABC transporter ATP-binding protein [Fimbriimonadaceae bacterium]|nr:ABC transporter ATP-binding protein [Fimbriimonadaceae bacterium]
MPRLFFRFDPRLATALRSQRKNIFKGLVCVAAGALLTAATIPLTEVAIRSINEAAPMRVDLNQSSPYEADLAQRLGLPRERIREGLLKHPVDPRLSLPPASALALEWDKDEAEVQRAIESLGQSRVNPPQGREEALRRLGWTCLTVIVVFLIKYVFTRGQSFYLSRAAARLAADLRIQLYSKLQKLPIRYFTSRKSGAIQSVLTNDVNVYQSAVPLIRDSIDGPFKAVAALVTIFIIKWQLAIVAILFIPVMAAFVQRNGRRMKQDQVTVQDDLAALAGTTNEALGGVRVVKAFAAEQRMSDVYATLVEKTFASQMRAVRRFSQLKPMVELIGAVSLATILYICGYMAFWGMLQISQIVALTFALDVINQGAKAMSNVNNTYNQVQAAASRIYSEVLDVPEEAETSEGVILPRVVGRIEFRDVSFEYEDGVLALDRVSFVIEPGTSLALVGPSGAGKTTIADLMLRFYDPSAGQVLLDGVDIRSLDLRWYRSQFGVVPQQTFLFAGTIEDNISLGRAGASAEEIIEAAQLAHADGFVAKTPDGYQTQLGERGAKISGGEGQRLAIARAIIRKPKVLLLDEATSNLDADSEKAVTIALDEVMKDRTTLFIAHRLTTAMRANKILVMRRGEVVEQGTPNELLQENGVFAAMWRSFNSGLIEGDLD